MVWMPGDVMVVVVPVIGVSFTTVPMIVAGG
jgi:hypothetical protein